MQLAMVAVAVVWVVTGVVALAEPLLFIVWPISVPVFLVAMLVAVSRIRVAWPYDAPLVPTQLRVRWSRAGLVVLAASSIVAGFTAVVPSMGHAQATGLYAYGMSLLVAPALCAATVTTSIHALVVTTPRSIAVAATAGVVAWPLLLAIRTMRVPILDLDNTFVMLRPIAVQLYVVAGIVIGGVAIALAFTAARSIDARMLPPQASLRQSAPPT